MFNFHTSDRQTWNSLMWPTYYKTVLIKKIPKGSFNSLHPVHSIQTCIQHNLKIQIILNKNSKDLWPVHSGICKTLITSSYTNKKHQVFPKTRFKQEKLMDKRKCVYLCEPHLTYEPHIRHSSLFAKEHTMAAVFRCLVSSLLLLADWASFIFSLLRVNWMGLAAGFVRR